VFLFKDEIYTCGGYLGYGKKSNKFEKYIEAYDEWIVLDLQLPIPLEACSV